MLSLLLVLSAALVSWPMMASANGAEAFATHCAQCHQLDGQGVPGIYPPLANSIGRYVWLKQGRAFIVYPPSFGMSGTIMARGREIDGFMPPVRNLSNADLAAILNYVLATLNRTILPADFVPFKADEIKQYRAHELSPDEVYRERQELNDSLAKLKGLKHGP